MEVAAGIVVRDTRVLVARRRPSDHLGGLWEFPGGKIETGESPAHALVRELREELAIEIVPGPTWGVLPHRYRDRHVRLHFLFAELTHGEPRPLAAEECRWAAPAELRELEFPSADRTLVDDLIRIHDAGRPLCEARLAPDTPGEDSA